MPLHAGPSIVDADNIAYPIQPNSPRNPDPITIYEFFPFAQNSQSRTCSIPYSKENGLPDRSILTWFGGRSIDVAQLSADAALTSLPAGDMETSMA